MTMDNGMDVSPSWEELREERDAIKRDRDNYKGSLEVIGEGYERIRIERDTMAAHVEAAAWIISLADDDVDRRRRWLADKPTTSLARLKAEWQAEALEDLAQANSRDLIHPQIVMDRASELRRQAEKSAND